MRRFVYQMLCAITLFSSCFVQATSVQTKPKKTPYYATSKYSENVADIIGRYVVLCLKMEKQGIKFDFKHVRNLSFTQPCVIRCYNAMIEHKKLTPMTELWDAYKAGSVDCSGKKFLYEFCRLIAIIFEEAVMRTTDQTNALTLAQLLDKINTTVPFDELIDILEQCYSVLIALLSSDQASLLPPVFKQKWVVCTIIGLVVVAKLFQRWYLPTKRTPVNVLKK